MSSVIFDIELTSERLLRLMLDGLLVKLFLALLHGPLKLPSEDGDVVVALQAIAAGEEINGGLRA